MHDQHTWHRFTVTVISTQIHDLGAVDITVIQESLMQKLSLQEYAQACLNELVTSLDNYNCISSTEYRLLSGIRGLQTCCQWTPTAFDTYMQIHGFVINKRDGIRLFTTLEQAQWRRFGKYLNNIIKTIPLEGLCSLL